MYKLSYCFLLAQCANHFIIQSYHISQAEFACGKSMLAVPSHVLVLHVFEHVFTYLNCFLVLSGEHTY